MTTVEAKGPDYVLRCLNCGDQTSIATPDQNPLWFIAAVFRGYDDEHRGCNKPEAPPIFPELPPRRLKHLSDGKWI
jgi:hypothetical protein